MDRPLVSVIVPSFNQGRFIGETIASCLAQDWRPLEILVLDGGSRDGTVEVLRSFDAPELRWWSEPDKGVVDAVNKGLARAGGEVLTIQSSDDLFAPGAISAAVQALSARPDADLVYGDVELIDEASRVVGRDVQGAFDLGEYLGRLQYIPQPGTCFTRRAMERTGNWRDSVSYAADADYWMRIACRGRALKMPRIVGRYRYHDEQRDRQRARIASDWKQAVRDLLASERLSARERRMARMGLHLADHRYAPADAWWRRTCALYLAAASYPPALADARFPKRELLPGREPLWRAMSRAKRALGMKPRSE